MSGVHQFLVAASPGDAITNMTFELRSLLRRAGESEIYARYVAPSLLDEVHQLSDYRPRHTRNVLVFHASMGQPDVHALLLARPEPIVMIHHNVTPAHYFAGYDELFADLLTMGQRELETLRPRVALAIAASDFNASGLRAAGYDNVTVIPPIVDIERLFSVEAHAPTAHHLEVGFDGPVVISVGQLLPHKRPDFLVQAMHVAATYLGSSTHLLLIGHQRLERYTRAIRDEVRELNLPRVHLVGAVDDAQLRAYYEGARAVLSASEHEGFGVPLLEAMAFGRPVVARRCAAIPETVGDAALLLPPSAGPELFAEAVEEVLHDDVLASELVRRGRERVAGVSASRNEAELLAAILEVV